MNQMLPIIPIIELLGLLFAIMLRLRVTKQDPGNQKMREVVDATAGGARAFPTSEYCILIIFAVLLLIVIDFRTDSQVTVGCFLVGSFSSTVAGYLGMSAAIRTNCRTANAIRTSGMRGALALAFSGDSITGMAVVGPGLMGVGVLYMTIRDVFILSGFSLGTSSIALSARVGGGIYTKAVDVGADLVRKVEAGILEDDPRNLAVIVDNVGNNVGDVVGIGVDLFESCVGSLVSALTPGLVFYRESGIIFPLLLFVCGTAASIIRTLLVKAIGGMDPRKALKTRGYSATALVVIVTLALSRAFFDNYLAALIVITGLLVSVLTGFVTEIYTSGDYWLVRKVTDRSEIGPTTTIISGLAVGMQFTVVLILLVCIGILISNRPMGLYGITLAAMGMLSTTEITVVIDTCGPIADNAGGIAEMAGLDKLVREITDKLGSVGNTMATIGKGFTIGSAAPTALTLSISCAKAVKLTTIDILNVHVIVGLFIGGMSAFLFPAMIVESVSRAVYQMIEEVYRQFRENPQIFQGNARPDYASYVFTSATAALRETFLPGLMAVLAPLATGIILGPNTLGGLLTGSLVAGVPMAISMSSSGGIWGNAKKYIEEGSHGGKGSTVHKAVVIGDTVDDLFKDVSGPSINTLTKLMTVVSLVFALLFL